METWKNRILSHAFFNAPPEQVAPKLLGHYLIRVIDNTFLVGRILETEAYLADNDAAAHNARGMTKANQSLFCEAGTAYVHAMRGYHLIDVVTEGCDRPGSVLIRAVEPIAGIEKMMVLAQAQTADKLANGPGKVCRAFGITREHDGLALTSPLSPVFICAPSELDTKHVIKTTERVGISKAKEFALRFHL